MIKRVPYPGHPNQCQAVNNKGQCGNLGLLLESGEYTNNCIVHGGARQRKNTEVENIRNYRLTIARWRGALDEKLGATNLKDLREEISLLRIVLEERLNLCKDPHDLILQSGPISDLVMKINTVVASCHKLEGSMGQLLDKQAILQFAQEVITIVTTTITDEQQISTIADDILRIVGRIGHASE